jgi:hypothetical protein
MAITFSKGISIDSGIEITAGYLSSGSSVYIQGSLGQYVNIPKTIANTSTLLGEHTIEFWLYQTQYNSTADVIWSNSAWQPTTVNATTMPSNKQRYLLTAGSSGNMQLTFPNSPATTSSILFTAPPLNTWNHIAINRVGGTVYLYVNGVYKGTAGNSSNNFATPVGSMLLGNANNGFNGYISNFRIVNGRSMYSGTGSTYNTPSFYPPLVPFTAPSTGTSTAGSTSSNINITTVAPGNNKAVTYEFWYYNRADDFGGSIGSLFAGATTYSSGTNGFTFNMGGSSYYGMAGCLSQTFGQVWGQTVNRWNHMAIVVYPGTGLGYAYWNGAGPYVTTTPVTPGSVTSTSITINGNSHTAGFRYTVGAALYTSNTIPVPTAPPTTQAGQPNGIGGSAVFSGSNSLTVAGDANTQIGQQDFTWEAWIYTTGNTGTYQTIISQRTGVSATQGSITFGSPYVSLQYLTIAPNVVFRPLTNDFTVEFWLNQTARGTFDRAWSYDTSSVANSTGVLYFTVGTSQFGLSYGTGAAVVNLTTSTNNLPPLNTWNHFAIVRNGNVLTWYMNGTAMATTAYTLSILAQVGVMQINSPSGTNFTFSGHITNFRFVNSVAVYTANFTPPTDSLTAVTGTQLLLLANSAATLLTDSSVNNLTVTNNNAATWGPATPYYAANLGYWLGISPGATQVVSVWNSNEMLITGHIPIGANSWHHVALTRQSNTLKLYVDGFYSGLAIDPSNVATQAISIGQDTNGTYNYNFTGNISNVRITTGQVLYQNTTGLNTYTNSFFPFTPDNLTPLTAGTNTQLLLTMSSSGALLTDSSANAYTVTNNSSVTYSSTNPFTWNTQICMPMATSGTLLTDTSGSAGNTISGGTWSPIAPWANETQLLLRATDSSTALTDSGANALALVNNGQKSGYFDGTTQYLTLPNNVAFDFSTATNFTIEAWVHPATFSVLSSGTFAGTVFSTYNTTGTLNGYALAYNTLGFLIFQSAVAGVQQQITATNNALTVNAWSHVAVTRSGSTYRLFVNGVQTTTTGTMTQNVNTNGNTMTVGGVNFTGALQYLSGFLSNLRVTSGAALYTTGFTPSTTPLTTSPGSGTVQLLLPLNAVPFTDSSANALTVTNVGTTPLASSGPFTQTIATASYDALSPFASPAPVMDLRVAPATATAGTVWPDASGNGNNGTLTGTDAKMARVSTNGGGIRFTASSSSPAYIATPFALSTTSFTVSVIFSFQSLTGPTTSQGLWDNSSVTATRGYLLQLGRSDINQYGMRIGAGSYAFYPGVPVTQFSATLTNVIYELTAVVTSERISVYANGQLINSGQQNASLPAAGFAVNTMLFGAVRGSDGSNPTGNLGCTLYNMRVYNTALTQAQVRANYNQYRSTYGI